MARTSTAKRKAPAKPAASQISLKLPTALVTEIDAIALMERRPRVKQIEVVLDEFAKAYRHRRETVE